MPTLYAGADLECSLCEAIFRATESGASVPLSVVFDRLISVITPRRDLHLVNLYPNGLARIGADPALLRSPASSYRLTAQWAKALFDNTGAEGLIWRSNRRPQHDSIVLWQGRVSPGDLVATRSDSLGRTGVFDRLVQLATLHGITLVEE